MTTQEKIEYIASKCAKASGDAVSFHTTVTGEHIANRSIHLAEVLLAINEYARVGYSYRVDIDGMVCIEKDGMAVIWNCKKDSLSEQSSETINFIYSLLA